MNITITIVSILGITVFAWLFNKLLPYKVCAICAGVSGTWLLMLLMRFQGYPVDTAILAMLLGASVAGIAYQLEKKLPEKRSQLLWKVLFIPAGFVAVYGIVQSEWFLFFGALVFLLVLSYAFLKVPNPPADGINLSPTKELEEKMKQCC